MKIEMGKAYRTKRGEDVRIYATDCGGSFPVQGARHVNDQWEIESWTANGQYQIRLTAGAFDLIEVKPRHKRTVWLNIYADHTGIVGWNSKAVADQMATHARDACIRVDLDFEEGEGL